MNPPSLTLGVEEEYQIVDPESRELRSYITEILDDDVVRLGEVKPELHQSIVEVGTKVCQTPADVRGELVRLRGMVMGLADRKELKVAAAGTHPFSSWTDQEITPLERYLGVKHDMQDLAQQLLIFGTHVHVGIEDPEFLVDAMNVSRYFMPHLLCLTSSPPFWTGRQTGLKSYRSVVFRNFPRTGVPRVMSSYGDFESLRAKLVRTGCIPDGSKIYWDLRPHHAFPTLEFRFLDVCTRVEEAVCVAAILQAIVYKVYRMRRDNTTFRVYPADLIEENKWRAVRYGLDGKLIDLGKGDRGAGPGPHRRADRVVYRRRGRRAGEPRRGRVRLPDPRRRLERRPPGGDVRGDGRAPAGRGPAHRRDRGERPVRRRASGAGRRTGAWACPTPPTHRCPRHEEPPQAREGGVVRRGQDASSPPPGHRAASAQPGGAGGGGPDNAPPLPCGSGGERRLRPPRSRGKVPFTHAGPSGAGWRPRIGRPARRSSGRGGRATLGAHPDNHPCPLLSRRGTAQGTTPPRPAPPPTAPPA